MKLKALILLLAVAVNTPCEAQFFKKLKDKVGSTVKETVNKRIEEKAEKKTEAVMDSLLEGKGKQSKRNKKGKSLGKAESYSDLDVEELPAFMENLNFSNMMDLSNDLTQAKVASSYTFDTQLTVLLSGPSDEASMDFYFGENVLMTQVEQAPEIKIIYDYNNNSLVTINESDKTVIGLPLDFMGDMMEKMKGLQEEEEEDTPTHFKKTGRSKNILGFRAEEYIAEDESLKVNFWFSEEVPLDNNRMLKGMEKMGAVFAFDFATIGNSQYRDGLMLEFTATEKENQTTAHMKVTKLMTGQHITINTTSYKTLNPNP
ncbi:MAG: hypothetical protein VW080_09455 [Flavobacteriaceae bacterium]